MTRRYSRFCPFYQLEATREAAYWTHRDGCPERPGRQPDGDHRDAIDRLINLHGGDAA